MRVSLLSSIATGNRRGIAALATMALHASSGFAPVTKYLSKDEKNKLFFGSVHGVSYTWRTATLEDKAESFDQVHCIGHKSSKYCPYRLRKTPNFSRSATTHSIQFCEKPLDDHYCNKELAVSFKGPAKRKMSIPPKEPSRSNYSWTFPSPSREQMQSAKQAEQRPVAQGALPTGGGMLISQSLSHEKHTLPKDRMNATRALYPPSHNLANIGVHDNFKTIYRNDFLEPSITRTMAQSRCRSAPSSIFSQSL